MKRILLPSCIVFGLLFIVNVSLAVDSTPVALKVSAAKTSLRPGETVTIKLSDFRDSSGHAVEPAERIVAVSNAGEILDGVSAETPLTPTGNQKAFLVGNKGIIEFDYRAPLHCRKDEVRITFFNSLAFGDTDKIPMSNTEPSNAVTTLTLRLNCANSLLLQYEEDFLRQSSTLRTDHHIRTVLRFDLEPWVADNMLRVTNLTLLEFKGLANRVTKTDHQRMQADTASAGFFNQLLLLALDPEDDSIQGLIYEAVPLSIEWHGDDIPEGPPHKVNIGPVSKHKSDKRDARQAGRKLAGEFPTDGETARRLRRMQRSLLQQFSSTQVHPDHQVKNSRGDTFYSGNGNWEKKFSNGHHRKTYHWELVLDE